MVKRQIKENDITTYLKEQGFKEIKAEEKETAWYKKASERPSCLKIAKKKYCSTSHRQ